MKKRYDFLIVGAGFTGSVLAERLASQANKKVLIVDKRPHLAGNAYDLRNEDNILYHKYGPHIFHTNSQAVFDYLSNFTKWRHYEHRVVGLINDRFVPIPFNLTSLYILFSHNEADKLKDMLINTYGLNVKVPILKMLESEHEGIKELAQFIYENVFFAYTKKQWGLKPEELSPSVTARVPVHVSWDDRYFQDKIQKMPAEGYTKLFERMLHHSNITILLNTSYNEIKDEVEVDEVIYTGPIDEFFNYEFGALSYRSLEFEVQTYCVRRHLPTGTVNYPVSQDFTRITEMGHLTGEWGDKTTILIEYPRDYVPNKTEPYYPVPREENQQLYKKYVDFALKESPNVIFCGRLGDYRYYNMDQAVGRALNLFEKIMKSV